MSQPTGYPTGYGLPPIGEAEILACDDESEFGLPEGLDLPGYEIKPPSEGGRYRGKTPDCPRHVGIGHFQ
jgi:hypothetical protein